MFDVRSLMSCFYHSILINKHPEMLNFIEDKVHGSYNIGVFLYADIDLMASPFFDKNELPWIREIVWHAQQMTRISNWVSTWERELNERDFSSGIFTYSLLNKIITLEEIMRVKENNCEKTKKLIVSKISSSNVENAFLEEWKKHYMEIKNLEKHVKTIDINEFLKGLEMILKYHLSSKGLK